MNSNRALRQIVCLALVVGLVVLGGMIWRWSIRPKLPASPEFPTFTDVVVIKSLTIDGREAAKETTALRINTEAEVEFVGRLGRGTWGLTGVTPVIKSSKQGATSIVVPSKSKDDRPLALFFIVDRHQRGADLVLGPNEAVESRFAEDNPQDVTFRHSVSFKKTRGTHEIEFFLLDLSQQVPVNHLPPSAPPGTSVWKRTVIVK